MVDSSTRNGGKPVRLRPGDEIRVEGIADGGERAPLDYIEVVRSANAQVIELRCHYEVR